MFKKKYRLPKSVQFFNARVNETPFFKLKTVKNSLLQNRYGFLISKKNAKSAVVRNKTKRRFRGCLENIDNQLKQGYDMFFIIKKNAIAEKTSVLCIDINGLLKKEKFLL